MQCNAVPWPVRFWLDSTAFLQIFQADEHRCGRSKEFAWRVGAENRSTDSVASLAQAKENPKNRIRRRWDRRVGQSRASRLSRPFGFLLGKNGP